MTTTPDPDASVSVERGAEAGFVHAHGTGTTPKASRFQGWTFGAQLASWAIAAVLLASIIAGPSALALHLLTPPAAAVVDDADADADVQLQQAGSLASDYVAAWLTSTRDEHERLATYVDDTALVGLPETAPAVRDVSIASVERVDDGLVSVQVAALVEELVIGEEEGAAWNRRIFAVAIQTDPDGSLQPVGMPAPVAAEDVADAATGEYEHSLPMESAPATAALEFLSAYLVGIGDIERYTSPGVQIAPITPAPYSSISMLSSTADRDDVDPTPGAELHLQVSVSVVDQQGRSLPATYFLTLTARAERWEITSLDPVPTA